MVHRYRIRYSHDWSEISYNHEYQRHWDLSGRSDIGGMPWFITGINYFDAKMTSAKVQEEVFMQTILVIGASGMLGQFVCKELLRVQHGARILVGDYQHDRGRMTATSIPGADYRHLDVHKEESIRIALDGVDMVIVVAKQKEPMVQTLCLLKGIACVDVTTEIAFIDKVLALNALNTASIVMAGFIPGLSGLMVKEAANTFDTLEEVNVALLQNTNAQAGATGVSDMLQIVAQDIEGRAGFQDKRYMTFGSQEFAKEVRKIEHAERKYMAEVTTTANVHYWTAWNEASFNHKITLLKKLGLLKWLANRKKLIERIVTHNPQQNERAYLTVEASGIIDGHAQTKSWMISIVSDYETTAMVAVAIAKVIMTNEIKGIHFPFGITNLHDVIKTIDSEHIELRMKIL